MMQLQLTDVSRSRKVTFDPLEQT